MVLYMFDTPINLHRSQTSGAGVFSTVAFDTPINLHRSQTG